MTPRPKPEDVALEFIERLWAGEFSRADSPEAVEAVAPIIGRALEAAEEAEAARWQERLYGLLEAGDDDGAGCESGDPLDVMEAALRIKIERLLESEHAQ